MTKYLISVIFAIGFLMVGCQSNLAKTDQVQNQNFGADDFAKGIEFANAGDYKNALRYWLPIASFGNVKAQYNIGVLYDNGLGVPQNYGEALKWYRLAANQGYIESYNNIGVMYEKGNGVGVDPVEALKWYRQAADKKFYTALFNIGSLYEKGNGVAQNYKEALNWYQQAANQGNASALNGLGYLYQQGLGVDRDNIKALNFYTQSANKNYNIGQYNLGIFQREQQNIPEAIHWISIAANQGNHQAQMDMANMFYNGQYVEQNFTKAARYLSLAAEQGDDKAQYKLGVMYVGGIGVAKDRAKAEQWLLRAAHLGNEEARFTLNALIQESCSGGCPSGPALGASVMGYCGGSLSTINQKLKDELLAKLGDSVATQFIGKVEFVGTSNVTDNNIVFKMIGSTRNQVADESIKSALSKILIQLPPPNSEAERNSICRRRFVLKFDK